MTRRLCLTFGAVCVGLMSVIWAGLANYKKSCRRRVSNRLRVNASLGDSLYHWPHSLGHVGRFFTSKYAGPKNLTEAFAWGSQHPVGRFVTPGMGGTAIDDKNNIYVNGNYGISKMSPDRNDTLLWYYNPAPHCGKFLWELGNHWNLQTQWQLLMNSVVLWGGAVFSNTERGAAFAVDMETGEEIWSTQVKDYYTNERYFSNGFVQVYDGVLVLDTINRVHALNASTGDLLWDFTPDDILWSFLASTPGDGTIVFQDSAGTAYRCNLSDGALIWKASGTPGSWTDGSAVVGPNNIVYAVNANLPGDKTKLVEEPRNTLRAYSLADGKLLWKKDFPKPPNNVPAVVRLGMGVDFSVVQPIGLQDTQNESFEVHAMDAMTGELQWVFHGPTQLGLRQASYDLPESVQKTLPVQCVPHPWSAVTVDAVGVVYIASQEGPIFALRDVDGDGIVQGEGEVASFETMRAFSGTEAPSFAPGMIVIAACDKIFVFRYSE